jgi:TPP-dependent pyruvate/acetoin dehydrogenase alpha subunit
MDGEYSPSPSKATPPRMRRFPAFDPPEYVAWQADADLVRAFDETWRQDGARARIVEGLPAERLLELYAGLLRARLHDVMLKRWVRQGVISKAWLATGEEAATIGPVHALDRARDVVAPMIRNAGACCEMGMPVADMLRGYLGTADSPSGGRDGHVGGFAHRVLQPISNIGNMPPVAAGIALAAQLRGERRVVLTWIGDGSVNAGPVHEALNFAAVKRLPVIFVIQNNQVALGTALSAHRLAEDFRDLHRGYGCAGASMDGNNVLDTFAATAIAADQCRRGEGPVIIAAETFRMGGHATHDEQEARHLLPAERFAYWGARDPIGLYEAWMTGRGIAQETLDEVEARVNAEVDQAAEEALQGPKARAPRSESALEGVYAGQ